MYDAYGRLIRVQRRANSLEEDPNLEIVSSERMYYDGVRRVTEVVSAPVLSKLASDGTIEVPDPIEAESGDEPDDKTANATFENVQLLSNELEIAVEYVWDVEGPVDTLLAYFGGTGYASAYGEGSSQRSEAWFVIQDQTGDPVAVLSAPMGSTPSGAPSQPMGIAWRGIFCNTGGVVFSDQPVWSMPALRIGHKGLHVERLDGPAYVFNIQYSPERLYYGSGRTSALDIGARNAGTSQTPSGWTPQSRDHSADLLILMRNRAMIASHGRFLQPDPNATGLPVMGDLSFGGSALSPPRPEVELSRWTIDGLNVLAYCGGDSVNRSDPSGLVWGTAFAMATNFLVPGPSDWARGAMRGLLLAHTFRMAWEEEVAGMRNAPRAWWDHSSAWVGMAMLSGVKDEFSIGIPGVTGEWNPLDEFLPGEEDGPAVAGTAYSTISRAGRNFKIHGIRGFGEIVEAVSTGFKAVKFYPTGQSGRPLVKFDDRAMWSQLGGKPIKVSGNFDTAIAEAEKKLKELGLTKPADYEFHHHYVKGEILLVHNSIHKGAGHHHRWLW